MNSNICGIDMSIDPAVILKHIKLVTPSVKRIGLLYDSENSDDYVSEFENAMVAFDFQIEKQKINAAQSGQIPIEKLKKIFSKFENKIDAFYLFPDPSLISKENFIFIIEYCAHLKIPVFTYSDEFVKQGALVSLSPDFSNIGSQLALLTSKILTYHNTPAEIGKMRPIGSFFSLNLKNAISLNLNIEFLKNIVNKIFE